jgi:isoquinoline 1-oxidoreductase beta subunit
MGSIDRMAAPGPGGPRLESGTVVNLSRRGALAAGGAGLLLALGLPAGGGGPRRAAAQVPSRPAKLLNVGAFLRLDADGGIHLNNPFVEGGQGIDTATAQIVAEELDVDIARFRVVCAPADPAYQVMFGDTMRLTGGSLSVRSTYGGFRRLGATARALLVQAASQRWDVRPGDLATEPGTVFHAPTGRRATYAELAEEAGRLPVPPDAPLKDPKDFRLIGKRVHRLEARDKSTGATRYGIDQRVEGMLHAFVLHGPRLGAQPAEVKGQDAVRAMPGVHSIHALPEGVAVLADSWWRARKGVEALEVAWRGGTEEAFSSARHLAALQAASQEPGEAAEAHGDAAAELARAGKTVEAAYDAPYLAHAQLEPPSALARFNADGTLDLWVPNQAPEMYQAAAAEAAGVKPEQVRVHSPPLGGFFGRHFLYGSADPFREAIPLARAAGRPVKVLWSREEEFKRDAYRPLSHVRFRAALGPDGLPAAVTATAAGEGPMSRHMSGFMKNPKVDDSAVEGLTEKPYAIPNRRVGFAKVPHPVNVGFWRSVGHSMNDFFYESFLDELAEAAGKDPYEYRLALLETRERHLDLLRAAAELSGGWRRGPFERDGARRARGVAMASPFGSETATIAEVSLEGGEVRVHDLWIAIDPGTAINPLMIEAQVRSAATIGLSSALLEEMAFENGAPRAVNYDSYAVLPPDRMPRVHVRIVESGAPMGGIGEPGTPGVPPAVANAVAALTGQRVRSLPLSKARFGAA